MAPFGALKTLSAVRQFSFALAGDATGTGPYVFRPAPSALGEAGCEEKKKKVCLVGRPMWAAGGHMDTCLRSYIHLRRDGQPRKVCRRWAG